MQTIFIIAGLIVIIVQLAFINKKAKKIIMTNEELVKGLADVTAQVGKIGAESKVTLQKVTDLETALGAQDSVSPAVQTAFEALKVQVQTVDDLIPDAPVVTTEPTA